MSYRRASKNWEGLARKNAHWSICTCPELKRGGWDDKAFFATGRQETDRLMQFLRERNIEFMPLHALDFGCGLGRLSRALLPYFDRVTGTDVSETMVYKARQMNAFCGEKLEFRHNPYQDLRLFPGSGFSFVLSFIVLQHIPPPYAEQLLKELLRVLAPGGLAVVQVPVEDLRRRSRIQKIKTILKLKERLSALGMMKQYQLDMYLLPETMIQDICTEGGAVIECSVCTNQCLPDYAGNLQWIACKESRDFVSKLFVIRKTPRQ